jgi:DNA polymerase phi
MDDEDDETEEASVQPDSEDPGMGSDDDDEEGEGEEDVDVELRNRLVEVLQGSGIDATSDNSDDEEELMNDEQMMAIDEQLAQVFRSRANEKKSGKGKFRLTHIARLLIPFEDVDAQREATHFKNRVLDLVDTFIKKQPSSPHIIRLIPTLVDLIVGTSPDERQLSDKAKGILRSRIGKSKELPSGADIDQISTVLNDIHIYARRAHSSDLLATLSQCSIYLSRTLLHLGAEESLLQIYRPSLKDFITRKNSALNASFFQEFIRRCPTSAWSLRGDLLDLSNRAVNLYRQSQAYQLLELLVTQLPVIVRTAPCPSENVAK